MVLLAQLNLTVKLAFIKEYARFENLAHARQIAEYSPIQEEDII